MEIKELLTKTQEEIVEMACALENAYALGAGNILVEGDLPFVLVAHCDTVYSEAPEHIKEENGRLYTPKGSGSGVGGDDRCGCWMLFEVATWIHKPTLLFCQDEETMSGSSVGLDEYDWSDEKCFIEIDGPGFGVFYSGKTGNAYLSEFMESFGLTELETYYNDIEEICKPGNPPGVTLGAAYYNQHQKDEEWISTFGLHVQLAVIKQICDNIDKLEYTVVPKPLPKTKGWKNSYGGYYSGNYSTYAGYDDYYDSSYCLSSKKGGKDAEKEAAADVLPPTDEDEEFGGKYCGPGYYAITEMDGLEVADYVYVEDREDFSVVLEAAEEMRGEVIYVSSADAPGEEADKS